MISKGKTARGKTPWAAAGRWAILVLLAAAAAIYLAPRDYDPGPSPAEIAARVRANPVKVLWVGLDGADWAIMEPMMAEGELPHLAALRARGSWGVLRSCRPMESPQLWTTMVTGKPPREHGITDYVVKVPGQAEPVPVGSGQRKVKALWNIVSAYGETTAFLNWWATYPAEPVNGVIVSDRYDADAPGAIYPPTAAGELKLHLTGTDEDLDALQKRFTSFPFDPAFKEKSDAASDDFQRNSLVQVLRYHLKRDAATANAACYLLAARKPDLVGVYIKGTDGLAHVAWKYYQPKGGVTFDVSADDRALFGDLLPTYYRWADEQLGRMLAAAGDDYTVVVTSDHGFHAKAEEFNYVLEPLLEALGFARLEKGEPVWRETRAYVFNPDWSNRRNIYLNVAGRERAGIIPRGSAPGVQRELGAALEGVRTTKGALFFKTVKLNDVAAKPGGKTPADVVVEVNPAVKRGDVLVVGGAPFPASRVVVPRGLSGDHRVEGAFIFAGPGIRPAGELPPADLPQIGPTLLALMAYPVARDMMAPPILKVLDPALTNDFPLTYVETYESLRGAPAGAGGAATSASDAEMREMLKGLGYIK